MTEKTLVIVSGYFSPLHCGHLDYLEAGASLGDRLIVIVNNDLQQKKKKGKVILPKEFYKVAMTNHTVDSTLSNRFT